MKNLFTLLFVALLSTTGANAQREIPLTLGGGWNAGFAGESDVYSYTINAKHLAAEFPCNVTSAEYSKCIVEFEEPLPENFAIPYVWKESADKEEEKGEYGKTVGNDTRTKFEVNFDPNHPYITKVQVQHMDDVSAKINKLKKLTLVSKDGKNNLTIAPTFGDWGNPANGTDDTQFYKGTVKYNGQYQQLKLNGVDGQKGVTIHVEFADNYENIQMCVDYEGKSEWPWIGSNSAVTFTTDAEFAIKNVGIQFKAADQTAQVTVNSATQYITYPTSTAVANAGSSNYWGTYSNNLTAVKLSDDVEVYNVTLNNTNDNLIFTKRANNKVAKGEGVLVKSTSKSFGVEVIDEELTKAEDNLLKATPTTDQVINADGNKLYKLAFASKENNTGLGFYWHSANGESIAAIPGKAYLAIPSSATLSLSKSIVIGDSETTSINGVNTERVNHGVIHNLAGQRVNRLTKGINIIGNKKVLVK